MNKCLVTKLKASTGNKNLLKVGEVIFSLDVKDPSGLYFDFKSTDITNASSVEEGNNFTVDDLPHNNIIIEKNALGKIKPLNSFNLSLMPKYNLYYIYSNVPIRNIRGDLNLFNLNILNIILSENFNGNLIVKDNIINNNKLNLSIKSSDVSLALNNITFNNTEVVDISCKNKYNNVTGNIDTWNGIERLQTLNLLNTRISGSLSTLAKMNISDYKTAISETLISGSIESFVNEKRKVQSSGSVKFSWMGNGHITFNGDVVATLATNTISWTDSTITYNDVTIDA